MTIRKLLRARVAAARRRRLAIHAAWAAAARAVPTLAEQTGHKTITNPDGAGDGRRQTTYE